MLPQTRSILCALGLSSLATLGICPANTVSTLSSCLSRACNGIPQRSTDFALQARREEQLMLWENCDSMKRQSEGVKLKVYPGLLCARRNSSPFGTELENKSASLARNVLRHRLREYVRIKTLHKSEFCSPLFQLVSYRLLPHDVAPVFRGFQSANPRTRAGGFQTRRFSAGCGNPAGSRAIRRVLC